MANRSIGVWEAAASKDEMTTGQLSTTRAVSRGLRTSDSPKVSMHTTSQTSFRDTNTSFVSLNQERALRQMKTPQQAVGARSGCSTTSRPLCVGDRRAIVGARSNLLPSSTDRSNNVCRQQRLIGGRNTMNVTARLNDTELSQTNAGAAPIPSNRENVTNRETGISTTATIIPQGEIQRFRANGAQVRAKRQTVQAAQQAQRILLRGPRATSCGSASASSNNNVSLAQRNSRGTNESGSFANAASAALPGAGTYVHNTRTQRPNAERQAAGLATFPSGPTTKLPPHSDKKVDRSSNNLTLELSGQSETYVGFRLSSPGKRPFTPRFCAGAAVLHFAADKRFEVAVLGGITSANSSNVAHGDYYSAEISALSLLRDKELNWSTRPLQPALQPLLGFSCQALFGPDVDKLLLLGGATPGHADVQELAPLYVIDCESANVYAAASPSSETASAPPNRQFHAAVILRERMLYLFGGRPGENAISGTGNPASRTPKPSVKTEPNFLEESSKFIAPCTVFSDLWRLDLGEFDWVRVPLRGIDDSSSPISTLDNATISSSPRSSPASSLCHTPTATVPKGRAGCSSVAWRNDFYIFGGFDGGQLLSDLWCMDGKTERWRQLSVTGHSPGARFGAASAIRGDDWVIHGGVGPNGSLYNDLSIINLSTLRCTRMRVRASHDPPRLLPSLALHNAVAVDLPLGRTHSLQGVLLLGGFSKQAGPIASVYFIMPKRHIMDLLSRPRLLQNLEEESAIRCGLLSLLSPNEASAFQTSCGTPPAREAAHWDKSSSPLPLIRKDKRRNAVDRQDPYIAEEEKYRALIQEEAVRQKEIEVRLKNFSEKHDNFLKTASLNHLTEALHEQASLCDEDKSEILQEVLTANLEKEISLLREQVQCLQARLQHVERALEHETIGPVIQRCLEVVARSHL